MSLGRSEATFYPDMEMRPPMRRDWQPCFRSVVNRCGFFYTNGQERRYRLAQTGLGRVRWIVYQDTCHDAQPVWDSDQIIHHLHKSIMNISSTMRPTIFNHPASGQVPLPLRALYLPAGRYAQAVHSFCFFWALVRPAH
jgi:hypothetical protein